MILLTGAKRASSRRRASVYLAVLSISMLVTVAGVGALLAARSQLSRAVVANDVIDAQLNAQSGIEIARAWVANDPNWRSTRASGIWSNALTLGEGTVTISGIDPNDNDLDNRPCDSVVLRAVGQKGEARHIAEATLTAHATPLDALKYAVHTKGEVHVHGSQRVAVRGAAISTDGAMRNEGALFGDVVAASVSAQGTISGAVTVDATTEPFPTIDTAEFYAALGKEINPGSTMQSVTLSRTSNPYSTPDPDGVYVIRQDSDISLDGVALSGTLVIISPGRTVSISRLVAMRAARADYPVLVIVGDVRFGSGSVAVPGLNPTLGINGLVHVRGATRFDADPGLKGVLLAESNAVADAVDFRTSVTIRYDNTLFENPPQGYAKQVEMKLQPGSWRRVVE